MDEETTFYSGYFARVRYKTKQKLRKLPKKWKEIQNLATELGSTEKCQFQDHEGDLIESQEDWDHIVAAFIQGKHEKIDINLVDEGYTFPQTLVSSSAAFPSSKPIQWTQPPQQEKQQQEVKYAVPATLHVPIQNKGVKRKASFHEEQKRKKQKKEEKRRRNALKWAKLRDERTVPWEGPLHDTAHLIGGLWFAQVCMTCLAAVQSCSLVGHLNGKRHHTEFYKNPRRTTFDRKHAILVEPHIMTEHASWVTQQQQEGNTVIPVNESHKFKEFCGYKEGVRVVVMGEQEFSYALALKQCGCDVVGTSHMLEHSPDIPDPVPSQLDDGDRELYEGIHLSSMDGDLIRNEKLAKTLGVPLRYGVDAMNIAETLRVRRCHDGQDQDPIEGTFDILVFPLPRITLFRGCDPDNSFLLLNFFKSVVKDKVLNPGGLVQIVCLQNQFSEWDIFQVGKTAGLKLQSIVYIDFHEFQPYQPRDLLGKPFSPKNPMLVSWTVDEERANDPEVVDLTAVQQNDEETEQQSNKDAEATEKEEDSNEEKSAN